jgi:septum site-determining protein MinC
MALPATGASPAPGHNVGAAVRPDALPADTPGAFALRGLPGGALLLTLDARVSLDGLKSALRGAVGAHPDRFRGASLRVDLGAREMDLYELRRVFHFLRDELGVHVVGLHCRAGTLQRFAERELKLKVHLEAPPAEAAPEPEPPPFEAPVIVEPPVARARPEPEPEIIVAPPEEGELPVGGARVLTVDGTVRSGAVVRAAGDVQVFGDVNPGAEVVAGGNVVVFGALKGMAHAGCRGDDRAIVLAFDMRPTQLRIGKAITLSLDAHPERASRTPLPEIAWIAEGDIRIEPYRGRLPGRTSKESV